MVQITANNAGISPRLLFALLGSALLHLAVLFGVSMTPSPQVYTPHLVNAWLPPSGSAALRVSIPESASPAPANSIASAAPKTSALLASFHREPLVAQPKAASPDVDSSDPTYYSIEQLDESPRLLKQALQVYPTRARNAGIEGFVILSLLINERGEVDQIYVVKSQPIGFFEESAIAMLRGQHFSPAIKQGKAVKSRLQKMVAFKLRDSVSPPSR